MTALEIRPTAGALGSEIHGLDRVSHSIRRLPPPSTTLCESRVVLFPEQKLSRDQHAAFSRSLGEVFAPHPAHLPTLDEVPEVVVLAAHRRTRRSLAH